MKKIVIMAVAIYVACISASVTFAAGPSLMVVGKDVERVWLIGVFPDDISLANNVIDDGDGLVYLMEISIPDLNVLVAGSMQIVVDDWLGKGYKTLDSEGLHIDYDRKVVAIEFARQNYDFEPPEYSRGMYTINYETMVVTNIILP